MGYGLQGQGQVAMMKRTELNLEGYLPPTHAEAWRACHARIDWDDERKRSTNWIERHIDLLKVPDGGVGVEVEDYFRYRIGSDHKNNLEAEITLRRGYERAQEVLKANVFEQVTTGHLQHPWGKMSFLEAKILLDALYEKKFLNQADAIELAAIVVQRAPLSGAAYWDSTAQGGYQFALDLLLLTEAWPQAQSMVDNARKMNTLNVKEPFRMAKQILKHKGSMADEFKAKLAYRQAFDMLRNPAADSLPEGQYVSMQYLFIMACIWQKFFEPGQGDYDYDKAIDLIWA
jgi:hypothetical protein